MLIREKLYTAEEFWQIARSPENEDKHLELDEGVIVEMPPSRPINTVIGINVAYLLKAYAKECNCGWVTGADGGFKLGERKTRQPDVGFVSKARLPQLPEHFNLAPDLAVEIVSENEDIFKKAHEYLRAGTSLVWAVYPDDKTVYVLRLNTEGNLISKSYEIADTLTGENTLPNLVIPVSEIFAD